MQPERKCVPAICVLIFKFRFIEGFIVGNGLCAVPKNVRQMARNDTQVVPYKVFAFYANTSINRDWEKFIKIILFFVTCGKIIRVDR